MKNAGSYWESKLGPLTSAAVQSPVIFHYPLSVFSVYFSKAQDSKGHHTGNIEMTTQTLLKFIIYDSRLSVEYCKQVAGRWFYFHSTYKV